MDETVASIESESFNIHEAADEIISNDSQDVSANDSASTDGQPQGSENDVNAKELSPEEMLKQVGAEKEDQAQFADLLKSVNSLGMVRNGLPVNIESSEQLKELIQKGYDYTQKTMEHAESVKAKEAEFQQKETQYKEVESQLAQKEQQLQDTIFINQLLGDIFEEMKTDDPELFAHLDALYTKKERAYIAQQPLQNKLEGKISELENQLNEFKGQKKQEELSGIKQGWEKELSETQTKHAASLGKIGLKVDWDKVQKTWAADSTSSMTAEQALFAVYGKDIATAYESHKKLLETKAKTQAKIINRSGVGSAQRGQGETIEAASNGDYSSILRAASATM